MGKRRRRWERGHMGFGDMNCGQLLIYTCPRQAPEVVRRAEARRCPIIAAMNLPVLARNRSLESIRRQDAQARGRHNPIKLCGRLRCTPPNQVPTALLQSARRSCLV